MRIKYIPRILWDDIKLRPLYWATMVTALAGAYWSSDASAFYRGLGFFVWVFSNFYLLVMYKIDGNIPMVMQFFAYEVFNVRGTLNNWFPGWDTQLNDTIIQYAQNISW